MLGSQATAFCNDQKKPSFTHFVDLVEQFSKHYINPAGWLMIGLGSAGSFFINRTYPYLKFLYDQNYTNLKPNLTYSDPIEQRACDTLNEVAQKADMNCNLYLASENDPYNTASNDKDLFFKRSLFEEPFDKQNVQNKMAYFLVRIKNNYIQKRLYGQLIGYPLIYGLLYGSSKLCKHIFNGLFKEEYTKDNAYYLKDIQRLTSLILKSPITFITISSIIFSKWDAYFVNRINTEAAQLMGEKV